MRTSSGDPVQGDVVRARLEAVAAELTRRAPPPDDAKAAPVPAPGRAQASGVLARAWDFGRAHAAVVGVIGLVALLGAVFTITRARTVPVAPATPTPVVATAAPAASSATATPEPLRVHVLGAVARPGVVRLPPGARVEDALAAAGGLSADARPGDLNLAAPVADGAQIVVGNAGEPGGEVRPSAEDPPMVGDTAAGGERLDLNRATLEQLDGLPGVGPVTAQAILAWRQDHQRFSRVEELQEVDGIGPKTFQRIQPLVRV